MPTCLPASQPSCCAPLRVFLAREGLARFCTAPYEPPRGSNLGDAFRHLTNYALNKQNTASYVFAGCACGVVGSKAARRRQRQSPACAPLLPNSSVLLFLQGGRGRGGRRQQQVAHLGAG